MDQHRALNALAPFLALAKSATSPRAAADLITQATSAPNTYVFAELLQQQNIQALNGHEQYGGFFELLKVFAWGTWEGYRATSGLPDLSDAQSTKLRLLSLLTIASTQQPTESNLSYTYLCSHLDLQSSIDLEHLVTQAIYNDLISATLNPASQTVVITSVAPLRDLAPGSVAAMMAELSAWSGRCDSVLTDLENEIAKAKAEAQKRHKREQKAEKQFRAVMDMETKSGAGVAGVLGTNRAGHNLRGSRRDQMQGDEDDDGDAMDIDGGGGGGSNQGGRKKSTGGGLGNFLGRVSGKGGR